MEPYLIILATLGISGYLYSIFSVGSRILREEIKKDRRTQFEEEKKEIIEILKK